MPVSEDTYQKIQRYLDQEMSSEELAAFEKIIDADQEVAREVALHKDMAELLADTPENKLRQSLKILNDQAKDDSGKPGYSLRYWLWLIPLFLTAIGWWFFKSDKSIAPSENVTSKEVQTEPAIELEEKDQTQKAEEKPEQGLKVPEDQNETLEPKEPAPIQKPSDTPPPIAANFEPNPAIEFLIENNVRNNDFQLEVEKRQNDITLPSATEAFEFQLKVILKTTENLLDQDFKLHLFSNDPSAFQDFLPLSTSDLALSQMAEDTFQIDFQKSMTLAPGLYYYILEDFTEEKIYFVDKFGVTIGR